MNIFFYIILSILLSTGYSCGALHFEQERLELFQGAFSGQDEVYALTVTKTPVGGEFEPQTKLTKGEDINTILLYLTNFIESSVPKNKVLIIVFNEMFFSPMNRHINETEYSLLTEIFLNFSKMCRNAIIYLNFLYTRNDVLSRELSNNIVNWLTIASRNAKYQNKSALLMHPVLNNADEYGNFFNLFLNRANTLVTSRVVFLVNETLTFFDEKIISKYKKSSYYKENDDFIYRNESCLYDIGDGLDHPTEPQDELSSLINGNIEVEICYDTQQGVRKLTTPATKKVHILQSNLLTEDGNYSRYPGKNTLTIHSDPRNRGAVFYTKENTEKDRIIKQFIPLDRSKEFLYNDNIFSLKLFKCKLRK